jgi:4-hydroxy-2-oxoglutarate aldolase
MPGFKDRLAGVFAPVVTPFSNEQLDLEALRTVLRRLSATGLTGFLALGSNGEFKSLSEPEERRVLEVFAQERHDKLVMVGTGCESAHQTLGKIAQAKDLGFGLVSVLTPHYFAKRMTDKAIETFYLGIAERSPLPIVLYNAPGYAGGVAISATCLSRLATHGSIAGIKDSSATGPGAYLAALDGETDFAVLAGSTNFFYPSLHLGAVGGVLSTANYLPEACVQLHGLFRDGRFDEATRLHHRLARVNQVIVGSYGVAGVKAAMELMGYPAGAPRLPLTALSGPERAIIESALHQEGFGGG